MRRSSDSMLGQKAEALCLARDDPEQKRRAKAAARVEGSNPCGRPGDKARFLTHCLYRREKKFSLLFVFVRYSDRED
jgi:hypothetical protein